MSLLKLVGNLIKGFSEDPNKNWLYSYESRCRAGEKFVREVGLVGLMCGILKLKRKI